MKPNLFEAVQEARAEWKLEDYVRFLRNHWLWIVFCVCVGYGVGFLYAARIPSQYQAKARLLIDRYVSDPVRFDSGQSGPLRDAEFLATEYQLIGSRMVAEQVLQELNLPGFPPFSYSRDPAAMLMAMIRIVPVRGTKLADVVATSGNPKLAMRIASAVAQVYTQMNLDRRKEQNTGGVEWLHEEVSRTESQLKAAQEALQRFKEEHQMVSLEDRQNVIVQRLTEISSAATEAKTGRLKAEAELSELERALAGGLLMEDLPVVQRNEVVVTLKGKISTKQGELVERRNVYGELHPAIAQLESEMELLKRQLQTEVQKVVEVARLEYASARAKEVELQQALTEQEQLALDLNRLELDYRNLNREVQASTEIYNSLAKRLKELEVAESLQTNNVRVVDDAKLPEIPVSPDRKRIAQTGLLLGLLIGAGSAFFREAVSTTIRTRKDMEELLGFPFLGRVLRVSIPKNRRHTNSSLFFMNQSDSVASEGVRAVRTTLEFLLPEAPCHRLLITSSLPEEGKSLVSANLAVALQELGRKVILIDADMRRPTLFRIFNVPLEPGLSTYLLGQAGLEDIVQVPKACQGLTVVPSGAVPHRPADLLAGQKMAELLEEFSKSFQYIILDTPPVLAVADATILSRLAGGAIVVARSHQTHREALLVMRQQLTQTPLKFIAAVLNDVRAQSEYGYRYGHYYHQGYRQKQKRPKPGRSTPIPPQSSSASEDVA
ncbi:MAG: polysaccharide biosynthesis tyrosine autokinase [Candidatus Omnitrophica bacterium]|nr:polysaccharide biosynthesis tyrosine autokinase [Candidatus Omnitrophota bacterium]